MTQELTEQWYAVFFLSLIGGNIPRRVLQAALKIRKEQAGELIKSARSIDVLQIPDESDWERCHTATSEPYFYNQSYTQVKRDGPICIDGKGYVLYCERSR